MTAHADPASISNTTYHWVLRSTKGSNWTSGDSGQASETTPVICV